jgi:hypothetical protein
VCLQEHAYSKAEAELRRATAALDEWSAAERQMLRDEVRPKRLVIESPWLQIASEIQCF